MWVSAGTQQEVATSLTAPDVVFGALELIASQCRGDKEFSKVQIWAQHFMKTGFFRSKLIKKTFGEAAKCQVLKI